MNPIKPKVKWLLAAALGAALVVGCGGGGGGGGAVSADISQSVSALLAYANDLIAGTSENGELVDVNALSLAADDGGEPAAF